MPLYPQSIDRLGKLKIKQYYTKEPPRFTATPFNIYVYRTQQIEYRRNTTLAETWTRMQYYNKLDNFTANYYIDKVNIWHSYPNLEKIIKVVLCDNSPIAVDNSIKLIASLMEQYQIPLNQVIVQFKSQNYSNLLYTSTQHLQIQSPPSSVLQFELEEEQDKPKFIPKISVESTSVGQEPNDCLSTIKLISNIGDITYRIWMGGTWQPWVHDDEICGAEGGKIQGFQFQYNSDTYNLLFRCKIKERGWLPWKDHAPINPYGMNIQSIEFKIEVK